MSSSPSEQSFAVLDAPAFSRQHLADLAAHRLAAVRVRGFLRQEEVDRTLRRLDRLPQVDYYPVRKAMTRFGPALNDYRDSSSDLGTVRYWHDAEDAQRQWREADMDPDPVLMALDSLAAAWGEQFTPATIDGRPAFVGMLREINSGTLLHYDDIHLEYPSGLFDQKVVSQLTFNVWLAMPERGGATTVWRHRWEPADDAHRDKYGYSLGVVEGCQSVTVTPDTGDALLFNPNHYHMVRPNDSEGRRITSTFFLGLTDTDGFVVWS